MKLLDNFGLEYFWNKIKGTFVAKSDLSDVATSGSYDDLEDKPSIPDNSNLVHKTGEETIEGLKRFYINADSTISIGNGEIKFETAGPGETNWNWISYDGKGTTRDQTLQQALDARNNVQADWNQTTTTAADYIKNKPTIKDELSDEYEMSSDSNDDLFLAAGDTYEEAFSKLEKAIIDNELVSASALNDLNINGVKKSSTAGLLKNDGTVDTNDYLVEEDVFEDMDANGHEYVDLGLPSGTFWATMNVGASTTSDYGNYYMWGKTTQYDETDTPYNGSEYYLGLQNDVASLEWGGDWHIPTDKQITELILYTKYERVNGNAYGKYTSYEDPTKYIIIPYSGLYTPSQPASTDPNSSGTNGNAFLWSNTTLIEDTSNGNAKFLSIGSDMIGTMKRNYGLTIRPVLDGNKVKNQNNLYIKPNWSLNYSSSPDYILNKPLIYSSPSINTSIASPLLHTGYNTWYYDSTGINYLSQNGTTSSVGHATLILGNITSSGSNGNKLGKLKLYGTNTRSSTIVSSLLTANRTLSFPDEDGTLATLAYVTANGGAINTIQVDGVALTINDKTVNITGKLNTLVSGTNIKTINNESILGSGNITIENVTSITNNEIDTIWNNVMATIINFSIMSDQYLAIEGMTWAEWVNSLYNTDGYYIGTDNRIYSSTAGLVNNVIATDVILPDQFGLSLGSNE